MALCISATPIPPCSTRGWRDRPEPFRLTGAWPPVLGETSEQAHALAEALGDHHDLAVLAEDLAGRGFEPGWSGALAGAIGARQEELAAAAFELGARLYAEKPKAYRRRMRAYWRAWRG